MVCSGAGLCSESTSYTINGSTIAAGDYTITNLVQNGSFEDGITSYYHNSPTLSSNALFGNRSILVSQNDKEMTASSSSFTTITGHRYYLFGYINLSSYTSGNVTIMHVGTLGHVGDNSKVVNSWQKRSSYYTVSSDDPGRTLVVPSDLRMGKVYDDTTNWTAYMDGFGVIDLTAAFGAGNEPSKEWCDAHIDYFDGSETIHIVDNNEHLLNNLIKDGSFEKKSLSNFTTCNTYSAYGSKSLCIDVSTYTREAIFNYYVRNNHIYYTKFKIKVDKMEPSDAYISYEAYYDDGPCWVGICYNANEGSSTNGWITKSTYYGSANTTNVTALFAAWSTTTTPTIKAYIDGVMTIDLTAAFGAGNEPDKEWCDAHISYYNNSFAIYR